jgi:multidrug resistance efflux pump
VSSKVIRERETELWHMREALKKYEADLADTRTRMFEAERQANALEAERDSARAEVERLKAGLLPASEMPEHIRQLAVVGIERDIAIADRDRCKALAIEACDIANGADPSARDVMRLAIIRAELGDKP